MPRAFRSEDVQNATFTQTQLRRGYDEREVDDFLDRATAALLHHEKGLPAGDSPLSSQDVPGVRFTQTQFRRGYDEEEVDTFLDGLAHTLQQHESGVAGADEPGPSAVSSAASSASPTGQRRYEFNGGILIEDESWGSRLLRRLRGDKG